MDANPDNAPGKDELWKSQHATVNMKHVPDRRCWLTLLINPTGRSLCTVSQVPVETEVESEVEGDGGRRQTWTTQPCRQKRLCEVTGRMDRADKPPSELAKTAGKPGLPLNHLLPWSRRAL